MQNPDTLIEFANYLADEAGKISKKYFRNKIEIETKSGEYPVTIADREVELHLRSLICTNYPDHRIIGEEFANHDGNSEYTWVIDPIDGTVGFSTGKPTYTTLIALLKKDSPMYGIIDQPINQERFSGKTGEKAYLNRQIISTAEQSVLNNARLNATTPYMFTTDYEQSKFELLRKQVRVTSFGGDAYAFGLLAAGHIDIIMEADLQYYDIAALIPIITAAGGIISDWQGKTLTKDFNGQCLACANLQLQQQVLNLINS
ncbi:inositol monophosphatase family protein [Aquella oligotrophica]|uniref:inositol-phosphate phosphatase n=1 Tax=Aquella oligotrophica TaxID=2067065 RepID=A0A2I7N879_9NEIS|nr:inositol monophosphatase family protein [Aquella oligotrophica]AUR52664.1 histidinol phosphate phosphatase [Aquella oligotrophica]